MLNEIGSLLSWGDKRKIGVVFGGGAARSLRSYGASLIEIPAAKKTADIWRRHHWFPHEMTSEKRV